MMVQKAEETIRKMLAQAGIDLNNPDPLRIWDVFKDFVQEPVECADDGVWFQCGQFDFTGRNLYYLDFVRQFTIEAEQEYDHMEQLHCEFTCEPKKELVALETNLWAYDFRSLAEFFEKVENLSEFQMATKAGGYKCEIYQEAV
jgi:hypothetical protein